MLLAIAYLMILFGGVFAWILAFGQLTLKKPRISNLLMSLMFFLFGYSQISAALPYFGMDGDIYRIIKLLSIICYYFIGPLLYLYFKFILTQRFAFTRRTWIHVFPGVVVGLAIAAMLAAFPLGDFDDYVFRDRMPGTAAGIAVFLLAMGSVAVLMSYMADILSRMLRLLSGTPRERRHVILPGLILVIAIMAVSAAWELYMLFTPPIYEIIYTTESMAVIAVYLLGNRYPEYLQILKLEAERAAYERSRIKGLDVDALLARLDALMKNERAFCDEDMSLNRLARELEITPHQLSEVLNSRLGMNFRSFINHYRVEEAKRLLLSEPERPVLSVASAVGFETLSVFYAAFRKSTGMTPTSFRMRSES